MDALESEIREKGWARFDLLDPEPVREGREALLGELRRLTSSSEITLENAHQTVVDDAWRNDLLVALTSFWRDGGHHRRIFEGQLPLFKHLLGPDLFVQHVPFLRFARPAKEQDNNGYHLDTVYGGTAYEISFVVPLVDLAAKSALKVMDGSHLRPMTDFPYTMTTHPLAKKGNALHKSGANYAPKNFDPWFEDDLQPVEL